MEARWNVIHDWLFSGATFILGILLGLLLFLTSKGGIWENKANVMIAAFVNIFRSIPFILLIILLIPFQKQFLIHSLGEGCFAGINNRRCAIYGRMVEIALREIDKGVIEAARSMGAKTSTIIWKFLYPESLPALISGITELPPLHSLDIQAMAGVVGAGGLGNLAFRRIPKE